MQALTDIENTMELLRIPLDVTDPPGAVDLVKVVRQAVPEGRDVRFNDVSFRYDGGIGGGGGISHLSLHIPAGGSVALVGASGSGKSTCTRLLCRLFDVQHGAISVCGLDVRAVTQRSLRTVVSCVSQDTVLFNASLRFNLCYGAANGATHDQVRRACALARVDAYLSRLPDGLESRVGERGLRLSGGEKQRLGIARALLRKPTVLVLDEATSALDTTTEREVQAAIEADAKGRCTLSVAHRLSTIVSCDEIVVLRDGMAVERGSHGALVAMEGGLYASLWSRQSDQAATETIAPTLHHHRSAGENAFAEREEGCARDLDGATMMPPVDEAVQMGAHQSSFADHDATVPVPVPFWTGLGGDGDEWQDAEGKDGDDASPAPSHNADARAELDCRFLSDLWLLLHIGIDRHPLAVLLSELTCVGALTALALLLLPIPSSYQAASMNSITAPMVALLILLVLAASLVLPLRHLLSRGNGPAGITAHICRRSLPMLFMGVQVYNVAGFFISIMPSLIYQALTAAPRQCSSIPSLLLRAVGYISAVALGRALVSTTKSSAALLWRVELTRFMHERYLHRGAHYHLGLLQPSVDNPDQRIAREVELWSTCLAELFVTVMTSLFNVLWYTFQTWLITGWQGPALISIFFVASATITRLVASPVAALTARVQAAEGDFRAMHATLLQASEATAMC